MFRHAFVEMDERGRNDMSKCLKGCDISAWWNSWVQFFRPWCKGGYTSKDRGGYSIWKQAGMAADPFLKTASIRSAARPNWTKPHFGAARAASWHWRRNFLGKTEDPNKNTARTSPRYYFKFFGRHPYTAVYHRIRFVTIFSRCFLCFIKCYEEMLRFIFHIFHLQFHPCQLFKHMPVVTANYISEHILAPSREGNKKKTPQRSTKYSFSMKNHWLSRKTQGNSWKMREFKL